MSERTLTPADIEAIATLFDQRVAPRYVDVAGVASYTGLGATWVRQHADDLGVIRIGDGPKPRLRFDLRRVDEYMSCGDSGQKSKPANPQRKAKRRKASGKNPVLLPVRGDSGPDSAVSDA